jgi:hypothetical protein
MDESAKTCNWKRLDQKHSNASERDRLVGTLIIV